MHIWFYRYSTESQSFRCDNSDHFFHQIIEYIKWLQILDFINISTNSGANAEVLVIWHQSLT